MPPPVDLKEMLLALRDVLKRAELFTRHAIKREALSVRARMGEVLQRLSDRVVRETVTEIVSQTAERLVQEEIERIRTGS